jgi:ABC-2 type transport system permease protein
MLSRIKAVIRREYLERVRTKAFWISTLVVPFFLGAVMILPAYLAARGGGEYSVAVIDLSGRFFDPVDAEVQRMLGGDDEKLSISLVRQDPGSDLEATRERIKEQVQQKDFDGMLVIPAEMPDEGQPEYVAPNVAAFKLVSVLERSVNTVMVADRLTGAGLDPEKVRELTKRVGLRTMKLGKGGEETRDRGQSFMLAYVFMMIIYVTVLMYGIYVMRGVLEEKSSHVIEVVISTVKPFELMLGKILGIGAVGLTQFLIWATLMAAISAPGAVSAMGISGMELPKIPAQLLFFFVVYFVLGFLLYGTLYAGIGAAFDTEQEAQNFQGVITMFLIVPLVLMMQILNQPDGTLSVVLSLIPFFTPMLMFLRITLTPVPAIQLIASVVLMVGAILACTWVVAKIYRVGILMHGSKPKIKDLIRWVREA